MSTGCLGEEAFSFENKAKGNHRRKTSNHVNMTQYRRKGKKRSFGQDAYQGNNKVHYSFTMKTLTKRKNRGEEASSREKGKKR